MTKGFRLLNHGSAFFTSIYATYLSHGQMQLLGNTLHRALGDIKSFLLYFKNRELTFGWVIRKTKNLKRFLFASEITWHVHNWSDDTTLLDKQIRTRLELESNSNALKSCYHELICKGIQIASILSYSTIHDEIYHINA